MFRLIRLKDKMTLWYTLLTVLTVVAFSAALYLMTSYVLNRMLEGDVRLLMQQITAEIENEDGLLTFEDEVPISNSNMFFITEADGSELASYGDDITKFEDVPARPGELQTVQGLSQRWLLLDSGIIAVDRFHLRVRVASSMATNDKVLSTMLLVFWLSIPMIMLLSILGGQFIAKRSLTPIRQIIHSADIIARGDFSARIPQARSRDELGELTDTLNQMLQSVEETFQREKRFTSDASHELRTPVAVIRAYVESLRAEGEWTQEQSASLHTVISECDKMQKIIAQLLTITRVQEGRYPLCMEMVDLHTVAEGVAETLSGKIAEQNMTLRVTLPEKITLQADQSLMTELLLNLTENAVKYGRSGGYIEIGGSQDQTGTSLWVRDNGIGIEEKNLCHLFERFFRVDHARDRSGTGLGLAIADWIVKAHQGMITVESKLEEGSTFTVHFPAGDTRSDACLPAN